MPRRPPVPRSRPLVAGTRATVAAEGEFHTCRGHILPTPAGGIPKLGPVLITPSSPSPVLGQVRPTEASPAQRSRYLALQQEADFALWRTREAALEVRKAYVAHLAGEGVPPSEAQLTELARLEQEAEVRYRELRTFLRECFGADEARY